MMRNTRSGHVSTSYIFISKLTFIQEMFDRIDKEEDGEVYLREVVDYLAVLDNNIQQSLKVHSSCSLKY